MRHLVLEHVSLELAADVGDAVDDEGDGYEGEPDRHQGARHRHRRRPPDL